MKKTLAWHHTRAGSVALWLGSIELAVPVLALTALALAVGTYLDSSQSIDVAREVVYGSWWFLSLMGLVCVSLVFAVVSRYPWKRRHIGFITVHAGLIALIAGGFWSMFGRVDGHLALEEGTSGSVIETQDEQIELVERREGRFIPLATAAAPHGPAQLTLAQVRLQVVELWKNSQEEETVTNESPEPFRAVQVQMGPRPIWVGQEDKAGGPAVISGLRIRVLPDGAAWNPPGVGSAERESLVVFGPNSAPQIGYVSADGVGRVLKVPPGFPVAIDVGTRRLTIAQQLDRARGANRTVQAPPAKDNRPALVLRLADSTETAILPFKEALPLTLEGRSLLVRFGPRTVPLPFEVRLGEFRKTDYPGTEMAMAYESYVGITTPGRPETGFLVYMNHPYIHGPWRVYQSGFVGENISVFSIMRDPGLPLTYLGSALLCLGIVITFYSRSLSWGHPGIPVAFADKERSHAASTLALAPARTDDPGPVGRPVRAGV